MYDCANDKVGVGYGLTILFKLLHVSLVKPLRSSWAMKHRQETCLCHIFEQQSSTYWVASPPFVITTSNRSGMIVLVVTLGYHVYGAIPQLKPASNMSLWLGHHTPMVNGRSIGQKQNSPAIHGEQLIMQQQRPWLRGSLASRWCEKSVSDRARRAPGNCCVWLVVVAYRADDGEMDG